MDTTQSLDIKADIGDVFRSVPPRFGEGFTNPPEDESMQMTLEQWPGGRWFRDRGKRHRSPVGTRAGARLAASIAIALVSCLR